MIRYFLLFVVLLSVSRFAHATIPVTYPTSRVKADASLWKFRTQAEMDALIKRNYNNPRASYYLINNAYQKGFATHAALVYIRNARSKKIFEPKMWVSAAYAAMVGGGTYAYSLHTPNKAEFMEVMSYTGFLNSELDLAVQKAPKSPEVLLMSAACLHAATAGALKQGYRWDNPQWQKVFSWLKQAQKLAPRWADAQYWYGVSSSQYWEETGKINPSLLSRAKRALLTAQRLDSGLTGSCAWMLTFLARDMKRPAQEQLSHMNTWFTWQPRYKKKANFLAIYSSLVREVREQRRANL